MLSTSVTLLYSSIEQKIYASNVQAAVMSCWAVKRIARNKIPYQDEENSVDDLVIANLDEQSIVQTPFLTFVPDEKIAEVTVQVRTKWKKTNKQKNTTRREETRKKHEKKNYTKNQKVKGNRKSGRS